MGELIVFDNGRATVLGGELEEPQDIVIYCDLCNEPVAITPKFNDEVFITCLKCHAVNHIKVSVTQESNDEPTPEI